MNDRTPDVKTEEAIRRWVTTAGGRVHFIGVGGIGMAGLAYLLSQRGLRVSGCDLAASRVTRWLEQKGIPVNLSHDPAHVLEGIDWVVRTPAVPVDHPELRAAFEKGLPVFQRGMVLPALLGNRLSVAVGGTHGKTTTTAMIAQILRVSGNVPAFFVGGEWEDDGGMADLGDDRYWVVEADESDGTLAWYRPEIAVVTNVEFDHMENFRSPEGLEACFRQFIGHARQVAIVCADDPRSMALGKNCEHAFTFGFSSQARICGVPAELTADASLFYAFIESNPLGSFRLPVPGEHNVRNALAAIAVALQLGIRVQTIRSGLESFRSVRRRFDKVVDSNGRLVISDYAHHPTEIRAFVQAALKTPHRRMVAVFQPHRYTRTLALGPDFPSAFAGLDEVVLAPVYAASETPMDGGTSADLARYFGPTPRLHLADSLEDAWSYLVSTLQPDDVLLVVGAGDVEKVAQWARERWTGSA